MKEREKALVGGLVVLMLIAWLGFPLHRADRFAGSPWGGLLGVTGGVLMLVPLFYMAVKRIPGLKRVWTRLMSMRTFLTWHIYAGVIGPLLVVIHSGHKYESPLGITLTAVTLLVVVSGFVGRYLMAGINREIREKKEMLQQLQISYNEAATAIAASPETSSGLQSISGVIAQFFARPTVTEAQIPSSVPSSFGLLRLTQSMADLEFAIRTHETFRRLFGIWLKFHIVVSCILYLLIFLHVYYAVHFGLRWFL